MTVTSMLVWTVSRTGCGPAASGATRADAEAAALAAISPRRASRRSSTLRMRPQATMTSGSVSR